MTKKTRPCSNCPFRTDKPFYLPIERKLEIANNVLADGFFPCHKANLEAAKLDDSIPCKGAAKFIENVRGDYRANVCFRLSHESIGIVDNSVPVYKSKKDFLTTNSYIGRYSKDS